MARNSYYDMDRKPVVSRGWQNGKAILRVISIMLCGAAIGLAIPMAMKYRDEAKRLGVEYNMIVDIAIEASTPESITLCARHGRGVHPGFHIAFELVFWLACLSLTGIIARTAITADENAAYIRSVAGDDSGINNDDVSLFNTFAIKTKVAAALFGALTVIRFVLFVRACVETHRRRTMGRRATPAVAVAVHRQSEATLPLTAYDPVTPMPTPAQYYNDYSKPAPQGTNFHEHPHFQYPSQLP